MHNISQEVCYSRTFSSEYSPGPCISFPGVNTRFVVRFAILFTHADIRAKLLRQIFQITQWTCRTYCFIGLVCLSNPWGDLPLFFLLWDSAIHVFCHHFSVVAIGTALMKTPIFIRPFYFSMVFPMIIVHRTFGLLENLSGLQDILRYLHRLICRLCFIRSSFKYLWWFIGIRDVLWPWGKFLISVKVVGVGKAALVCISVVVARTISFSTSVWEWWCLLNFFVIFSSRSYILWYLIVLLTGFGFCLNEGSG